MLEQYKKYLIDKNYKPNTIKAYANSVEKICKEENITPLTLSNNIKHYVRIYDKGWPKEKLGNIGHDTWINALKRFQEFVNNTPINIIFHNVVQNNKTAINEIKELSEKGLTKALIDKNKYYEDIFTNILKKL